MTTLTITTPGVHTLSANHYGSIVIMADNVHLNMNGYAVLGSNAPGSIGVRSYGDGTIVTNGTVAYFDTGIYMQSSGTAVYRTQVSHTDVVHCHRMGIGISGDDTTIHHTQVGNIESFEDFTGVVTIGTMQWGEDVISFANNVHNIKTNNDPNANYEAVGIGINGTGRVIDCRVQGQGFEGREFGFWHSGQGVTMETSWIHDVDYSIGAAGYVTVQRSTLQSEYGFYGTGVIDGGGNVFIHGDDMGYMI